MDSDDWQLEAVHEQFQVFNSLTEPHCIIEATNLREVINTITCVVKQHFRDNSDPAPFRNISAEIVKTLPEKENRIKLSYIVIVTNKDFRGQLSKLPIFVVSFGEEKRFIDSNSMVYNSWDAYISSNNLPACKFCFPVNGSYRFGGKLIIDFASSPSATQPFKWSKILKFGLVGVGVIAASFFFKIPPTTHKDLLAVADIAKLFSPTISRMVSQLLELSILIKKISSGEISIIQFTAQTTKILQKFKNEFDEEIFTAFVTVRTKLHDVYRYLQTKLKKIFYSAPKTSQNEWMATVSRYDSELTRAVDESEQLLEKIRKQSGTPNKTLALPEVDFNLPNRKIFDNCIDECALKNVMMKNREIDVCADQLRFNKTTDDILTISERVALALNDRPKQDIKDLYVSINCIVLEEYNSKINNYTKMVEAAKAGAGHNIDLKVFNKSLGIECDPKDFYMNESMQTIREYRLLHRLKEKVYEKQKEKQIELIPVCQNSDNKSLGVYKCVGVRGAGKFSYQSLVKVLNEKVLEEQNGIDKESLVINETDSLMFIKSEKFAILVLQEVNTENNTSEGVVVIN